MKHVKRIKAILHGMEKGLIDLKKKEPTVFD